MSAMRLGIVVAAAGGLWLFSIADPVLARGATVSAERGEYLVKAGNCAECHTADGGKPFAGGRAMQTPFGTIYSTNITPDPATGIGRWTNKDLYRAMHEGVGRDGKRFYPVFPYPWFTKVDANDVRAIKSYLDTLPIVRQKNKSPKLPWPFSVREVMIGWNVVNFQEGTFRTDPNKSARWNRGAYLVEGLGHCGECHSPKDKMGAIKTGDQLQGGFAENWYASNLGGDLRDGLGAWSTQEIVEYLKNGSNAKAAAAGPMAAVVRDSTTHLNNSDLNAIATYLKDLPKTPEVTAAKVNQSDGSILERGKALYTGNCIGCHFASGVGMAKVFPPLKASAIVQAKYPDSVLQVIIGGGKVVTTKQQRWPYHMPAFGRKLSDQKIADVASYVRNAWGNRASVVNAAEVAKVRKEERTSATK
jgi:mono/diheme cytochrome c family protein